MNIHTNLQHHENQATLLMHPSQITQKNTSHAKNISKFQVTAYSPKHWSPRWENVELWICQVVAIIQNSLKSQTEGHQKSDLLKTSGRVTSRMEACDRLKTVRWWILLSAKEHYAEDTVKVRRTIMQGSVIGPENLEIQAWNGWNQVWKIEGFK